jgi:hypothetical protein
MRFCRVSWFVAFVPPLFPAIFKTTCDNTLTLPQKTRWEYPSYYCQLTVEKRKGLSLETIRLFPLQNAAAQQMVRHHDLARKLCACSRRPDLAECEGRWAY